MKIAFLDRDGTINKDYPDANWTEIMTPEFYPDTFSALRMIQKKGYEIIIITNQYLIGEGYISQAQYDAFTVQFLNAISEAHITVLDIFYCPHSRIENCRCCKPAPGMLEEALQKYPEIVLGKSFFAGDTDTDKQLAAHFALPFYLVNNAGKGAGVSLLQVAELV
ncbi:MAG: D-glycero-alpha-D-manno-heptose-1,7-bisphosphate 7-phosphatase [Christensenellaceae bacterium]